MENVKKNPILMGILNFFGTGAAAAAFLFIWSLADENETFLDKMKNPAMIALVAGAAVIGGVQSFLRVRKANAGGKK